MRLNSNDCRSVVVSLLLRAWQPVADTATTASVQETPGRFMRLCADMTNNVLSTTLRLSCRQWIPDDVDDIHAVYSDEEGARFVDDGLPISHEECVHWMDVTLTNYSR